VKRRAHVIADAVTGARPTVALRVPAHPVAHALLEAFGGGVAAPSANRFGRVSPTTASHVRADLGSDVDCVLDGGPATVGVESTIVDCTSAQPAILRLGGVAAETIERILGAPLARLTRGEVAAPGTLDRHYSPAARVIVTDADAVTATARELLSTGQKVGLLAIDPPADRPAALVTLVTPADADDFARVLYARLREADEQHFDALIVVAPPADGIGAAVADRLSRAAAGLA
jgi:L-threonylcarbamoyladenylate synthase